MSKRLFAAATLTLTLAWLTLSGCTLFAVWFGGECELSFAVDTGSASRDGSPRAVPSPEYAPTHVGVFNFDPWDPVMEYVELDGRPVKALVPKGEIYAIAVYGTDGSGRIVPVGPVRIGSFDLDAIPIGEDGESFIDLGALVYDGTGFVSSMDAGAASDGLGYSAEALRRFGAMDRQVARILNPDANGNGAFDADEGIYWSLEMKYYLSLNGNAASLSPDPSLHFADLATTDDSSLIFYTTEDFGRYFPDPDDLRLGIPATVLHPSQGITDSILPSSYGPKQYSEIFGPIADQGGSTGSGAFGFYSIRGCDPAGPWPGDYAMHIGNREYDIRGVSYTLYDGEASRAPFPVYSYEYDAQNMLRSFSWKWYRESEAGVVPADPEFVALAISEFVVSFETYVTPGPVPVSVDVEDFSDGGTLTVADFGSIDLEVNRAGFFCVDSFGTAYGYCCQDTYKGPR